MHQLPKARLTFPPLAVWDGNPAQGPGGTADIVAYARKKGTTVHLVQQEREGA
jgi:hypothetical protein